MHIEVKRKIVLVIIALLLTSALAFTKFYSLGYLVIVILSSLYIGRFFIFKTYLQKLILSLLVFMAIIPLVGLVCSLLRISVEPIYNVLAFLLSCLLLYSKTNPTNKRTLFVDRADLVGIIVAVIPVIILLFSYATAPNLRASLFQFASEGWDNGSHIVMLEGISTQKGYLYNDYPDSDKGFAGGPVSYPQAWHLATADLANGFGEDRFNSKEPISTIFAYTIASVSWMLVLCYLMVICSWRCKEYLFDDNKENLKFIAPLAAAIFTLVLIVVTPALMHGFTNYIGTLVYLVALSAMVIESRQSKNHYIYILASLFGCMSVLTWFLTLPAVGLTILLMYLTRSSTVRNSLTETLKDWRIILAATVSIVAMVTQVLIFQNSPGTSATDQLNVGVRVFPFDMSDGGPLQISPVLFGLLTATIVIYISLRKVSVKIKETLLILVVPWLFLALVVYFYQNITVGYNSYYLPKVIGLSLAATILPLGALFSSYLSHLKFTYPRLTISSLAVIVPCLVIIGTGQPPFGLTKLFQTNARTSYSLAETIVPLMSSASVVDGKSTIVVLTSRVNYEGIQEDHHGKLEIRVMNHPKSCTYNITRTNLPVETKLQRLASCANKLAEKKKDIIVVTSPDLIDRVTALDKSNVRTVVVY